MESKKESLNKKVTEVKNIDVLKISRVLKKDCKDSSHTKVDVRIRTGERLCAECPERLTNN